MPPAIRIAALLIVLLSASAPRLVLAQTATVGGVTFTNQGLVGVGRIPAAQRDKFGETYGSLSGLALDLRTWRLTSSGTYAATLYTQPDRGYVKAGVTTHYLARTNKLAITFKPDSTGSGKQDQLVMTLTDTKILTEANGTPLTGLDPSATTSGTRPGFPALPQAFNGSISLDAEGLVLLPDGTFFICDEYGPYIYRFSADGILLGAIRPPEALIPKRGGQDSFSANNPAVGQPAVSPSEPVTGRQNNKGFEGLSVSADSRTLYALMQTAPLQEGGGGSSGRFTRLFAYDITNPGAPKLSAEWVLPLPLYRDSSNAEQIAEQHECLVLNSHQLLLVAHDGNGRGASDLASVFRAIVLYDFGNATNIAGSVYDSSASPISQKGVLANNIVPATSATLVDLNDPAQIAKFNLNNNANGNSNTLSAAWESLALVPVLEPAAPDDYFLLVGNDNNFLTSNGFRSGVAYSDSPNVDTMILVYRLTLPGTQTIPSIITPPPDTTVAVGQSATFSVVASGNPAPTFQWTKNGAVIANATGTSLSIPNASTRDIASYAVTVSNSNGSVTSSSVTLAVTGANFPAITTQPLSQTVATGSTAVFSVTATDSTTFQWRLNGVALSSSTTGANSATLIVSNATAAQAGTYTVSATNSNGTVTSTAVTLAVTETNDVGRLINFSVLTDITTAVPSFTLGTVVSGPNPNARMPLVVRAAGPSLAAFGVPGTIADPKVDLLAGQTVVATNDNWGGDANILAAMASVGAFAYVGPTSKDAALYSPTLAPRDYTVAVSGVGGATGTVLAEIYDATPAGTFTTTTPRLINASVLKQISANGSITLSFTIGGVTAKTVLIRAIGPGLAAVGVTNGTLADPQLTLFNRSAAAIATNDNWGGDIALTTTMTRVGAFVGFSAASKDAMLLVTLPPGGYTAQASGIGGAGGLVIVEAYEVP